MVYANSISRTQKEGHPNQTRAASSTYSQDSTLSYTHRTMDIEERSKREQVLKRCERSTEQSQQNEVEGVKRELFFRLS